MESERADLNQEAVTLGLRFLEPCGVEGYLLETAEHVVVLVEVQVIGSDPYLVHFWLARRDLNADIGRALDLLHDDILGFIHDLGLSGVTLRRMLVIKVLELLVVLGVSFLHRRDGHWLRLGQQEVLGLFVTIFLILALPVAARPKTLQSVMLAISQLRAWIRTGWVCHLDRLALEVDNARLGRVLVSEAPARGLLDTSVN